MTLLGRLLLAPFILLSVVAATITLVVWWLPLVILSAAAGVFLLLAVTAERRGMHLRSTGADPAEAVEARLYRAERERTISRAYSDLPLFGNVVGYFRLFGWYIRFMTGGMGMDPDDPRDMRWWAAALLLIAAFFGTLGVASHYGAWLIGLPVLFALLLTSAAVALSGPAPVPVPDEAEA